MRNQWQKTLPGAVLLLTAVLNTGCSGGSGSVASQSAESEGSAQPTPTTVQTQAPTTPTPTPADSQTASALTIAPGTYGTPLPLVSDGRVLPPPDSGPSSHGMTKDPVTGGTNGEPVWIVQNELYSHLRESGITTIASSMDAWNILDRYCVAWFDNPDAPQSVRAGWIQELLEITPQDHPIPDLDDSGVDDVNVSDSPYWVINQNPACSPKVPTSQLVYSDWPNWQ